MTTTPHIAIETITPEIASQYLELNIGNRLVRESTVKRYAIDMAAGHWRFTGEPIQFCGTKLMNGQHRLMACVRSGASFTTLVVRNVDPDAFEVMDSGVKRTLGDVLHRSLGMSSADKVAAAARIVMAMRDGIMPHPTARNAYTRPEVIAHVQQHSDLYSFGATIMDRSRVLRRAPLAAFVVLARLEGASPGILERFFDRVHTGENLSRGDARLALRNWATNLSKTPQAHEELAALIYAWNAWARGADSRIIKKLAQGAPMPTIDRVHPVPAAMEAL